jgi:hypothetical protein
MKTFVDLRSFIYLFNEVFLSSDYTASNGRIIIERRITKIWKEMLVTQLQLYIQHFLE